ncbi:hypothetical protein [Pantoea cypripedii]|uniref:Uncharacterized protein n=1 Tax=Pantoea cypripedii TaxID=55209 RepID=A0A1X1EYH6_PANCY|nr:hypothetical protein [Pantoea cypripedii]MBP2195234.1 hypothetical protein [Pantoea cypripedii]ORM95068.1 hypothetical protein HA50_17630 [Pantoea cypripedii]
MDYFTSGAIKGRIGDYLIRLKNDQFIDEIATVKADVLQPIIESFYNAPEIWDSTTHFNIASISETFFNELASKPSNEDEMDMVISSAFRFCIERQLKSSGDLPGEIRRFKEFCIERKESFSKLCQEQIDYALHDMPVAVISSILNSDEMKHFKEIPSLLAEAEKITKEWSEELDIKTKKVDELQSKLEKQKTAFNFVGLYEGFDNLSSIKNSELMWAKLILFGLGLAIVVPIIYEIYSLAAIPTEAFINTNQLIKFVPVASLTIILIYYFRVSLSNFQSIRSQIVQIELRKTLCAFIQSYVEYAKEIKAGDSEILKKFEDVVFTNIMTTEEKVPSTFDGLEQVAGMISALKGGK